MCGRHLALERIAGHFRSRLVSCCSCANNAPCAVDCPCLHLAISIARDPVAVAEAYSVGT
ncbi:hypothetical protein CMEL01_08578 [Colletotrichum melonis]|uniref:Uncharacterized protein n=1 Tax=Colletotrichum melonis TaxID=1209925 RepID=A0AAI9U0F1_9PEZI|nr:hypothetical protein CMEL01_08578 [Colletotrichum melonis]